MSRDIVYSQWRNAATHTTDGVAPLPAAARYNGITHTQRAIQQGRCKARQKYHKYDQEVEFSSAHKEASYVLKRVNCKHSKVVTFSDQLYKADAKLVKNTTDITKKWNFRLYTKRQIMFSSVNRKKNKVKHNSHTFRSIIQGTCKIRQKYYRYEQEVNCSLTHRERGKQCF